MKRLVVTLSLALGSCAPAHAQDIRHDTVAIICNAAGTCAEMLHPNPLPSLEACEAENGNRYRDLI